MRFRKFLIIFLGVIIIGLIIVGVWSLFQKQVSKKKSNEPRDINVSTLTEPEEQKIATIMYPGGKVIADVTQDGSNQKVIFETTDSPDGAAAIYYQDLLNRYKTYDVSKKTITRNDSLNKKAIVIVCSGKTGKITVTVWGKTDGMTQVEVVTSSDFK